MEYFYVFMRGFKGLEFVKPIIRKAVRNVIYLMSDLWKQIMFMLQTLINSIFFASI